MIDLSISRIKKTMIMLKLLPCGLLLFSLISWLNKPVVGEALNSTSEQVTSKLTYSFSVILVEFSDVKHSVDRLSILERLENLSKYVKEASYGTYNFQFYLTAGWYSLPGLMESYDKDIWQLLNDSVIISDNEVDFKRGPRLMIIHAGPDEAYSLNSKDIRSQYYNVHCGAPLRNKDGVTISSAIILSEFDSLGAFVHEFLHMLGALDLYGGEGEREKFVGPWDPMATGHRLGVELVGGKLIIGKCPSLPSSWTRIRIGWLRSSDVYAVNSSTQKVKLIPLEYNLSGIHVLKIPVAPAKYYLIEVRRKIGFDLFLPMEGFAVYLCNDTAANVFSGMVTLIDAKRETASLDDALFQPGEEYVDNDHGLVIRFLKENSDYVIITQHSVPDLWVQVNAVLIPTEKILINMTVGNAGRAVAKQAVLRLFVDGVAQYASPFHNILPNQSIVATYSFNMKPGYHQAFCEIYLEDEFEYDENNNRAAISFGQGQKERTRQKWNEIPYPGGYVRHYDIGDFDGDRRSDILFYSLWSKASGSECHIVRSDGTILDHLTTGGDFVEDMDGDGTSEICFVSYEYIKVISYKKGGINWSVKCNFNTFAEGIRMGDVNADGIKDIVLLAPLGEKRIKSKYGGDLYTYSSVNVYAFSGCDGTLLKNFTVTTSAMETFEFWYGAYTEGVIQIIAVDDFNGDGNSEILVQIWKNDITTGWYDREAIVLYLYSLDGVLIWRKEFSPYYDYYGKVFIGDFNQDGSKEILCGGAGITILLDWNGNVIWTIGQGYLPPAFGQVQTPQGKLVLFSRSEVICISPANGEILWKSSVPFGEEINWRYATSLIHDTKRRLFRILLSTDKSFYILNEQGKLIASKFFGTYSWFSSDEAGNVLLWVYNSVDIYRLDLFNGTLSKLFTTITIPQRGVSLANLDDDSDSECIAVGSLIEAYDTNGSLIWVYGPFCELVGSQSRSADLDNDGYDDVCFFRDNSFQQSWTFFRNGRTVYGLEDCCFEDINGDGFCEAICASDRGLEVYDVEGNLIWKVEGADFRQVSVGDLIGDERKEIVVCVGIFAHYMGMPPQVRIYSDCGKLLMVIGYYWDPPYAEILRSESDNIRLLAIIGPWGRGEDHLEVYEPTGRLVFDRIISEGVWRKCYEGYQKIKLVDINGDGRKELVVEPYAFSLDGELLSDFLKMTDEQQYLLISDLDDDGQIEFVQNTPDTVRILNSKLEPILEIPLGNAGEYLGYRTVVLKSGPREITFLVGELTLHGYAIVPLRYFYVNVNVSYPWGSLKSLSVYLDGHAYPSSGEVRIPALEGKHTIGVHSPIYIAEGAKVVFDGWYKDGTLFSREQEISLEIEEPITLEAVWHTEYLITATTSIGQISGTDWGWYRAGENVTISIAPTRFLIYVFEGWRVNGTFVSTSPSYSFTVRGRMSLTASWKIDLTLVGTIIGIILLLIVTVVLLKRKKQSR